MGDFILLNIILYVSCKLNPAMVMWQWGTHLRMFLIISNLALLAGEWKFHTMIHERVISAGDVLKSVMMLTATQAVIAYILMRHIMYWMSSGKVLLQISIVLFLMLLVLRLIERNIIKHQRSLGRNTRKVTFVGSDVELIRIYEQLIMDPTTGYNILGYYADEKQIDFSVEWLGTVRQLIIDLESGKDVMLGDELYVCLSRRDKDIIKLLSMECDRLVVKFFYVPLSVEAIGLNLKREYINDFEIYTTHKTLLEQPEKKLLKRCVDIVLSIVALCLAALVFPIVWLMIKLQSPGPIFFKQERTGLDGRTFACYKFRSMHVNKDADRVQATKDDPRKFPFGTLMRKTNIDELPQFWNVLCGDMSIVGPRPHMLVHTEMYSKLIDKYMVRHFVKPGVTGWAQVTGYRGETKELWQMEERVKRDIWYMEHWTIWLDIRIIWLTIKNIFVHDEHAY